MALAASSVDSLRSLKDFWQPIGEDEASYCTRRLEESDDRLVLRASRAALVFCTTFLGIGAVTAFGGLTIPLGLMRVNGGKGEAVGACLTLLAIGAIFVWVGWIELRSALEPLVFDRRSGRYWRGRDDAGSPSTSRKADPQCVALADVVALQFLEKRIRRKRSISACFELNLVLQSGKRVSLVDHAKKKVLESQAETLVRFLRVPLMEGATASASEE